MNSIFPNSDDKNLPTIYNAIVDYHNNLVQMRFTIAGLCLAATGFLMNSWFSPKEPYVGIPILGIFLTVICILLECRTRFLLNGLGARGIKIETKMNVDEDIAFFKYMDKQDIPEDLPKIKEKVFSSTVYKKIVSHTFAIRLLYAGIIIAWIIACIVRN